MGYEHYWSRPPILDPEIFAAWADDVRKIIDVLPDDMLRGRTWEEGPYISPTLVHFNGNCDQHTTPWADNDAGMPFAVPQTFDESFRRWRVGNDPNAWIDDACKTRGKPYDTIVIAALVLLNDHFPNACRISSDGNLADWQPALEFTERVVSRRLYSPIYRHTLNVHEPVRSDTFALWSADVAKVIATTDVPLAGPDRSGEPIITQQALLSTASPTMGMTLSCFMENQKETTSAIRITCGTRNGGIGNA